MVSGPVLLEYVCRPMSASAAHPPSPVALFLMPCNRLKRYIFFCTAAPGCTVEVKTAPAIFFNLAESNQLCNTLSVFLFAKLIKYLWMFLYWREKNSRWRSPRSQSHFRNACACQSGHKKGSLAKKEWGGGRRVKISWHCPIPRPGVPRVPIRWH